MSDRPSERPGDAGRRSHGPPSVELRDARPGDGPALRALQSHLDSPASALLDLALGGGAVCPVAIERERPVGYALALDTDPAYLAELVVAPDARRAGVGSLLLRTVRARVDAPLRLTVRATDQRARSFYASHGATLVERLCDHYELDDGGTDGLLLELPVGEH